ncbi:MAG TPA: TetR/AcrR family transcriptional regulator [Thermoleophilaceae bacterium]
MPGLRERKKAQTRDRIVREALALFRKRGYDGTTVADIADAAEIAPRTFFAYFDTKEAVVFHDLAEVLGSLRARLEDRGPDETTFDAFRDWIADWLAREDALSRAERSRRKLIRTTPALRAQEELNRGRFQDLLADSVARDLGLPPGSVQPRLVGAAAAAALAVLDDSEQAEAGDAGAAMAIVDEALAFLGAGLRELRRRPR